MSRPRRHPTWSDALTGPLAAVIPAEHRAVATRPSRRSTPPRSWRSAPPSWSSRGTACEADWGRRARLAAAIAVAETVVYASNDQVCPLTPLAEELGEESGTVTDLYLPRWASDRMPLVGGTTLLVGIALHLVAWRRRARPDLSSGCAGSPSDSRREHDDRLSVDAADGRARASEPLAIVGRSACAADRGLARAARHIPAVRGSARDDDHVAGRAPRDLGRDAPEDQPTDVQARAGPEHDHVGAPPPGRPPGSPRPDRPPR